MKKILVATTNKGKLREIAFELEDLNCNFIGLDDITDIKLEDVDEDQDTLFGNAFKKAYYYSKTTGLPALADDTGLFIDALDGWPGLYSARVAKDDKARRQLALQKLKGKKNRKAKFVTVLVYYDHSIGKTMSTTGIIRGEITKKEAETVIGGFGYDPIFYVPEQQKTFAEMSDKDKNLISHRGLAISQLKYLLWSGYNFRQFLVPVSIIVKDKKIFMARRRDFRPEYNNKWEFPGGSIDPGESPIDCLLRETKEETGYNVTIEEQLPTIMSETVEKYNYQVFLLPYICSIKSGKLKLATNELIEHGWFSLPEALEMPVIPLNKKILTDKINNKILKKYIK